MTKYFWFFFVLILDISIFVVKNGLNAIQAKINRRPREKLNFSSPNVEFFKHFL